MGRSSLAALLAVAALAGGCGGEDEQRAATTQPRTATTGTEDRCVTARAPGFRLCGQPGPARRTIPSTIQRRDATSARRTLAGPPDRSIVDGIPHGHWAAAWLSPDGEMLLAQWSAECEIPIAFFVEAHTGEMRPVTGEANWADAPESIALGWNADGRARVRLTKGYCGGAKHPPGVYLIDPSTGTLTRAMPAAARG
jgi:hypothetical protein